MQSRLWLGAIGVVRVDFLRFDGVVRVDYKPRRHGEFPNTITVRTTNIDAKRALVDIGQFFGEAVYEIQLLGKGIVFVVQDLEIQAMFFDGGSTVFWKLRRKSTQARIGGSVLF